MIIDGYWLKLMWAVLTGGWFISALIRLIVTALNWLDQRGRRLFAVIVSAIAGVVFVWRHGSAGPCPRSFPSRRRTGTSRPCFVTWAFLDGIRGGVPAGRQNPKFS